MDKTKIRTMRLNKEQISLQKEPIENALAKRDGDLKFYFCLYKLQDDFKNGFYFGLLQLHYDYPFAAPKLFMYTPNGRYDVNIPICTSFTNYHQESWTSAWNVRSLIKATQSFMYSTEPSYGCRADPPDMRKVYARESLSWNMDNQKFRELFEETIFKKLADFVKDGIHIYDKKLALQLKKMGLEEANKQNLSQKGLVPQVKNYSRRIEEIHNRLDAPLIDNQEPEVELQMNGVQQHVDFGIQRQLLINEQKRKKKEKAKKIIKIIGCIAGVALAGVFVYYYWMKPSPEVSTSKNNSNLTSDSNAKQKGILDPIFQISKNMQVLILNLKKSICQKWSSRLSTTLKH